MITVTDYKTAVARQDEFDLILSFREPGHLSKCKADFSRSNHKQHIGVFSDVEYKVSVFDPPPEREHIESIIEFYAKNNGKEKNVISHCTAGIGRSTAVAIGLLIIFHDLTIAEAWDTIETQRRQMWPNDLVLKHFDEIMVLGGQLVKHSADWKESKRGKLII